ncbi:MAG: hypothetical protein V8S72_05880 [Oscillospiraceae bacterium]
MDKKVTGFIIRRERMRRDWSQDGLCRGICAASYLSKIEQGRVEASEEVLRLLYQRLGLPWYGGDAALPGLSERIDELYELVYSGEFEKLDDRLSAMEPEREALLLSPAAPDIAVLEAAANWRGGTDAGVDAGMEQYLSPRGLALLRLMQDRDAEAAAICPSALCSYWAGVAQYESGRSYTAAVENLQRAYSLAAGEGRARLMMLSRAYIGNCYCNQLDVENMEAHYTVAERLATALHDAGMLASIRYNRAATALETGDYESAYRYFSALEEPTAMALHKLAICCEKLGRRDEAFSALNRAAAVEDTHMPAGLAEEMLSLVRRRLENPDYLRDADYGAALLSCFERCRRELPIGYAAFHLPWLLEWYTANRQYKLAYELVNEFSIKLKI